MRAKQFFYMSAGVLVLMVAVLIGFHLGQSKAEAQGIGEFTGISRGDGSILAITSSGDVYGRIAGVNCNSNTGPFFSDTWPGGECAGGALWAT